jgi:hypothetical protein
LCSNEVAVSSAAAKNERSNSSAAAKNKSTKQKRKRPNKTQLLENQTLSTYLKKELRPP